MLCLIRPPAVESFRFVTTTITLPLGLAYIAGAPEAAGHTCHVIDSVAEGPSTKTRYYKGCLVGLTLEDIVRRVPAETTRVGISVIFTHEWPAVVRLIELLKRARPDVEVILGGEHVTSMPEFCLATSKGDFLVLGEGEESLIELLAALDEGRPLDDIPGIAFRSPEGGIVVNPRRARRTGVDEIPWPAWHLFDVGIYSSHHLIGGMDVGEVTMPILATRGCPYQCTFCSSPNMWTPRWIPRDPAKVVDEIEYYVKTFGASNFPFQDLTAIIQKDWTVKFCEELIRRNLDITWQFPSGTRSEAIDFEVAELMKQTGMVSIAYAPESGSEETRQLIKKKMGTENLLASIKASADADLNVSCFTIIGFPHDTEALLEENIPFVKRIKELGVTDLAVGYFFALPGTELFDSLYDAGHIRLDRRYFKHILQGGDIVPAISHSPGFSRLQLMKWKFRIYKTFYSAKDPRKPHDGFRASLWRAFSGLFTTSHDSKLQTVFRTALLSGWDELRLAFTRGWLSRSEEAAMFAEWDDIYRGIRGQLVESGVAVPGTVDSREIHRNNVIRNLRSSHNRVHRISAQRTDGLETAESAPPA